MSAHVLLIAAGAGLLATGSCGASWIHRHARDGERLQALVAIVGAATVIANIVCLLPDTPAWYAIATVTLSLLGALWAPVCIVRAVAIGPAQPAPVDAPWRREDARAAAVVESYAVARPDAGPTRRGHLYAVADDAPHEPSYPRLVIDQRQLNLYSQQFIGADGPRVGAAAGAPGLLGHDSPRVTAGTATRRGTGPGRSNRTDRRLRRIDQAYTATLPLTSTRVDDA